MKPIKYRRDLWQAVQEITGDVAEIGVAEGRFSEEMLSWPIPFPKLYLVDRWQCVPTQRGDASNKQSWHQKNWEDAHQRVARFNHRVVFLRGDSVTMSQQVPGLSLRLVYVDGDHSYEGVLNDIHAWLPKLVPGGVMAFHDYENPNYGVKKAVELLAKVTGTQIYKISEDKMDDAGAYIICDNLRGKL